MLLLLALAAPADAQKPIVRVIATPKVVPVGEPVTFQVTVLVPTWFPKPPRYPGRSLHGAGEAANLEGLEKSLAAARRRRARADRHDRSFALPSMNP